MKELVCFSDQGALLEEVCTIVVCSSLGKVSFNYPTCCSFFFWVEEGFRIIRFEQRFNLLLLPPHPPRPKTKREPRICSGFPEFLSSHSVLRYNCNVHMKPLVVLNPSVVGARVRRCYLASDHHRFIPTLVHCSFFYLY